LADYVAELPVEDAMAFVESHLESHPEDVQEVTLQALNLMSIEKRNQYFQALRKAHRLRTQRSYLMMLTLTLTRIGGSELNGLI